MHLLLLRQTNVLQNISAPPAAEIFRFHVYWVCILLWRQKNILQNISTATTSKIFHFHVYWVYILCSRQNNIFWTISAQTAAEMVCFHVYWVPILWSRQNNIPQSVLVLTAAEIFHFHMYSVHILSGTSHMYCHMLSSNIDQCWPLKYSHHICNWATLCYLNMQKCIGPIGVALWYIGQLTMWSTFPP